jgi:glycosyltransferase involved in cell wall biosynthesis
VQAAAIHEFMTGTPLVSIIITAWNRAGTVEHAINSALGQTFQDFEIVLVDDASTDNIAEVVAAKTWPKLTFVRNKVNRGIAGAKNAGIEAARGRYIAFLDSDDTWQPRKLEVQLAALQQRNGAVPLSFTAFYIERVSGLRVARVPKRYGSWLESSLLGEMFALGSTLLADRVVFDKVGPLDEKIRRMEDRDWILRYFDHWGDMVMVEEPLAVIVNSGWPRADLVRSSMAGIYAANKDRVARHGERYHRMFRSGMELEIATVEYRNREYLRALGRIAGLLARDPVYLGYTARRLAKKMSDRDPD